MKYEDVLRRFKNVRGICGHHTARCPAHNDKKNSLSISLARDGRALIHCHAGCNIRDIVAAAKLEMKDLYPISRPQNTRYAQKERRRYGR